MTAPDFGDLVAARLPSLDTGRRIDHPCIAHLSLDCPYPGPHRPPAPVDPATVPAFPDLEPSPSLWSAPTAAQDGPGAQDEPEHVADDMDDPTEPQRPEPTDSETWDEPEPAPAWRIVDPLSGATLQTIPADLCGRRYSDTQDGPLTACTLAAGHPGRHETRTRRRP